MRYVIGGFFLAVGLLSAGIGGSVAQTGKNVTGLLGRGFTKSDDLRMQRAPTAYFRAMGSRLLSIGLLIAWMGVFFLTIPIDLESTNLVAMFSVGGLFIVALIGSAAWITVLAARYKLFRWNKP